MIARALQEEYNREHANRSSSRRGSRSEAPPSAPSEGLVRGRRVAETDEEFAKRLAQEEERLYRYHQKRQARNNNNTDVISGGVVDSQIRSSAHPEYTNNYSNNNRNTIEDVTSPAVLYDVKRSDSELTPATSQAGSSVMEVDDAEYARRVEQELNDEELARRIQEQRASRYAAREAALAPSRRCTFNCFCGYLIFFTLIAAGVVGFAYYFYMKDNGAPRWIWDPSEFADEDPFDAKGPEDVTPWRSNGRGLELHILNALEDKWHEFFYAAVLDWDTGYPDALTLTSSTVPPEKACDQVSGQVKVCNGNYGPTSWKGINEVHIHVRGYIYASTARMNDYYFNGNKGSMQYTMYVIISTEIWF